MEIANQQIKIRGARQHNLKNINLDIPKNQLIVFTGVSGSGKSSMAFDTIYAEGQRRYVESLSTYARQFLGIMEKPDVDSIEGLSPAISIDQKTTSKNPRSTVGTVTEIYDYLRLLFARIGHPHCPVCGREIATQTVDEIKASVIKLIERELNTNPTIRFLALSPVVKDKKGEFSQLLANLKAKGYSQIRVDGQIRGLNEELYLIKTNKHSIEVVVDKFSLSKKDFKNEVFRGNLASRLLETLDQALKLSDGLAIISHIKDNTLEMPTSPKEFEDHLFSEKFSCPVDNIQIPEIEPRSFSFNSPHGACSECAGIGHVLKVDPESVFSWELSITEGAILPFSNMFENETWFSRLVMTFCEENDIETRVPLKTLDDEKVKLLLNGTGDRIYEVHGTNRFGRQTQIYEPFKGILNVLEERYATTSSEMVREITLKYMKEIVCPTCSGTRLKSEILGITIDNRSIYDITAVSILQTLDWINCLIEKQILNSREKEIGKLILKEIHDRLIFLIEVGLDYLSLSRTSGTLSGGEAQRIRLASQIGSGLTGVLYVLDEPTIGLHQKDNNKLIKTLKKLKDLGNTVIVVEHDEDMIRESDHVVDFGPGAGKYGGEVVSQGSASEISNDPKSLTGQYLSGVKKVEIGKIESAGLLPPSSIKISGCRQYNLKNINVAFPLSKFVVITGVSGSGKSTLLVETLYPALFKAINKNSRISEAKYDELSGNEFIEKVILIDQSPIGRTPRSNPATYTKVFDLIRDLYSQTREARSLGFKKGRFSFNVKGGRCEACEGQGETKIEMQFMSDIWVKCEVCKGTRYNSQTLEVSYRGKNIAEVLALTVDDALEFFHSFVPVYKKLETLKEVGLGYMQLGQSATTLSGGEAQRIKLATELSKREAGKSVYILDEPTTGLHLDDIQKLLYVLKVLVARGNSVYVIEHNLDVVKNADWIIDLGPGGGENGGNVVAQGSVSDIMKEKSSFTGQYLKKHLNAA